MHVTHVSTIHVTREMTDMACSDMNRRNPIYWEFSQYFLSILIFCMNKSENVYTTKTKFSLRDVQLTLNLSNTYWIHFQYSFIGFMINSQERKMFSWLNCLFAGLWKGTSLKHLTPSGEAHKYGRSLPTLSHSQIVLKLNSHRFSHVQIPRF